MDNNELNRINEVELLREYLETLGESSAVHDQLEGLLSEENGSTLNLMEMAAQEIPGQAADVVLLRASREAVTNPCTKVASEQKDVGI